MKISKMKRISGVVAIALAICALAVAAAAAPVAAVEPGATDATVYFDPQDSSVPGYCETTEVDIMVDIAAGQAVTTGLIKFDYTYCCADVIDYAPNLTDWDFNNGDVSVKGQVTIGFASFDPAGVSGLVPIGTITIHCCDETSDCSTALAWDTDPAASYLMKEAAYLEVSWQDGSFTCGEVCVEGVVVSGVGPEMPPADGSVGPMPPPWFEPKDQIPPCEWVYVWGYGFEFCQDYEIYIQPYEECHSVVEGQVLDHTLSAALGYPDPGTGPVIVHIGEDGTFGPVKLFDVPEGLYCTYWEIVADKIGAGHEAGIYNACEDGLDAVACDEYGFHIVPEALTLILLSTGLVGLGGYYGLRRKRSST